MLYSHSLSLYQVLPNKKVKVLDKIHVKFDGHIYDKRREARAINNFYMHQLTFNILSLSNSQVQTETY